MAFTRQHYVKIADILKDAHNAYGDTNMSNPHGAVDHVARRLADVFADDNPRFDYDRFHAAAGTKNH
jgi:hypothetical protein